MGRGTQSPVARYRPSTARVAACCLVGGALISTGSAQEAVRASLAGEEAAAARRTAASSPGYYNLQLGPTAWRISTGLGFEANDNIRLVEQGTEGDLIFRPEVTTHTVWPLTDKNSLNLSVGAGYSAYARNSDLDRFFITPGSELSFDLYVGDCWINVHDRISITENSYQDPTVVGVGNYSQLQNDVGVTATWDLNELVLQAGYDHVNYALLSGASGDSDGSSEVFNLSAGCNFEPGLQAGLEVGGGILSYSGTQATFTRAYDWNVGPFLELQLTEKLRLRADAGYTVYSPEAVPSQPDPGDFTAVYGQVSLVHQISERVDYTLSGGRTINFAFFGGTIDLFSVQVQTNWKVIRGFDLSAFFQYDHGAQVFTGQEDFDRYGPGVGLGHRFNAKLSSSLRYQFYQRQSDLAGGDYSVNSLTLNLTYQL